MKEQTQNALQATQQKLNTLSKELVTDLNQLVAGNIGLYKGENIANVRYIDIEVFADGFRLSAYPMDNSQNQLGHKELLNSQPDGALSGYDFEIDYELYDPHNKADNEEIDGFYKKQQELFIAWFVECWQKADIKTVKIPIYLMMHDTDELLDLQNNKWVSDNER